jgi:hypothetical protein
VLDKIFRKAHGLARRIGIEPLPSVRRFEGNVEDVPEAERSKSDLHKLFYAADGPHLQKWQHYLSIYDRYLSRFRGQPVRLLEIGVLDGGSLRLWRQYFGSKATIFGIDIDQRCAAFNGVNGQVRIGSQADPQFLQKVVAEMGGVDIVIDDGSHVASHQRVSFETLFPLLNEEGVYICEDLHTAYWRGFHEGGYRRAGTFIEIAKGIVDDMHSDFHRKGSHLRDANRSIAGISFHNSMAVIEKSKQERPRHLNVANLNDTTRRG